MARRFGDQIAVPQARRCNAFTAYAQEMFEQYARDPESVPEAWRRYFADGGKRALGDGLFVPEQLNGYRGGAEAAVGIRKEAERSEGVFSRHGQLRMPG